MKLSHVVTAGIGLLVGAALVLLIHLNPPCPRSPAPAPRSQLIDGKYLLVQEPGQHWIYERGKDGWKVSARQYSPEGLKAIWALQGQFLPYSVDTGNGMLVNVPVTQYSAETGSFQVVHRFYRFEDNKLVEVQMEGLKPK